jgi:hypothetical protein
LRDDALDAKSYSISGQQILKPDYSQSRFGITGGGALRIPKLIQDDKTFFFVNYFGTRGRNPFDAISTMPSAPERLGDFSQSAGGKAVPIFDLAGRTVFPGSIIPASRQSSASLGLLELFPYPNQPGYVQNYQYVASVPQNSDNFGVRVSRSLNEQDRLSLNFNLQRRNGESANLFGFRDTSEGQGLRTDLSWSRTVRTGFVASMRVTFSRNVNKVVPYFANGRDWAGELGIQGTSRDPRTYGPPNLSFTNFGSLSDANPSSLAGQTAGIGGGVIRVWKRHNFSFGADYRRQQSNNLSQQNARGTMSFSGLTTSLFDENGYPLSATGFDFADFLLGYPQTSSIRFGNPDTYFRGSNTSVHFQDDWRIRSNFTINGGLRYEVNQPLKEKYGRMVNLDIAPGFTGVAPVSPGTVGPYSGPVPASLVETDWNNLAPRLGFAWRPFPSRHFQVRGGYGWYFNGPVTNQSAGRLAQQPPFAQTGTLTTSVENPLTIETGFATQPSDKLTNTYAVDRYYRTGYAQTWNLSLQQDLPLALVLEVGYLGTKGTRLDMQRLPNSAAPGSPLTAEERRRIGDAVGFLFDSSEGNSIYHAAQVHLNRRFRAGLAANASYIFGKSIDNASSFGGAGGGTVAQNDRDLAAERGLSSFDRRHTLNLNWVFSTYGLRRGGGSGFWHTLTDNWSITGNAVIRSGQPFTAQVLGNRSDQGGTGVVGSSRANSTGLPVTSATCFFNLLAFAIPSAGSFGNASRNTIPGPGFFAMNFSLGRMIPFKDGRRGLDLRLEANNVLNSVNISRIGTTINARNYGVALSASQMRNVQLNIRFRF